MEPFHQRNKFLICLSCFSGVYLKCIEKLIPNKRVVTGFKCWRVIVITLLLIHFLSDIKFVIFDEGPGRIKQGVSRRAVAFLAFIIKTIFFYVKEKEIDDLLQLWNSSFKEDLYKLQRKRTVDKVHRRTLKIVQISFCLIALPSISYGLPPYFSKSKKLPHPTGIPYREQSPDYEAVVTFDFLAAMSGLCLSGATDCIIMVILSMQQAQLEFLHHCLAEMVSTLSVDDNGNILIRHSIQFEDFNRENHKKNNWLNILKRKNSKCELGKNEKQIYTNLTKPKDYFLYKRTVDEFERQLKIWIIHHQEAIRFFDAMKTLFSPLASLQMFYVVFYTCFTAFQIVAFKTTLTEAITIPLVATSNLVSLFTWSKICDDFDPTTRGLFGGAFGKHWFLYPKKIRNAFYFITMRCKKPLTIYGLSLFPLTSVTFFEIIKVAYQIFAFMMQVHHKSQLLEKKN